MMRIRRDTVMGMLSKPGLRHAILRTTTAKGEPYLGLDAKTATRMEIMLRAVEDHDSFIGGKTFNDGMHSCEIFTLAVVEVTLSSFLSPRRAFKGAEVRRALVCQR